MHYDSAQIKALPGWPAGVWVSGFDGQTQLSVTAWNITVPVSLGDIAVTLGSAEAGLTAGETEVSCVDDLFAATDTECFHNNLLTTNTLVNEAIHQLRAAAE